MDARNKKRIADAASAMIAVADDLGMDLVDVIAETERFIVEETKVGDATKDPPGAGRYGYTLRNGRLVTIHRPS